MPTFPHSARRPSSHEHSIDLICHHAILTRRVSRVHHAAPLDCLGDGKGARKRAAGLKLSIPFRLHLAMRSWASVRCSL